MKTKLLIQGRVSICITSGKYILGAGLSGLIFSHYNPEYKIISADLGGKLNNKICISTINFPESDEIKSFLQEIKIPYYIENHVVKYMIENEIIEKPLPEEFVKYTYKLHTPFYNLPKIDKFHISNNLFNSENEINMIVINSLELIKGLIRNKNEKWINKKITKIETGKITLNYE